MDLTPPAISASAWLWTAFDPILVVVAAYLGWRADQAGKIAIAAIAALGITLLADAALTRLGIPWTAPFGGGGPTFVPVRAVAAVIWAAVAYGARRFRDRQT